MSIKVSASDGLKVYTISGGKNIPAWLSDKKKRSLRKDEEYQRRVELLQDFEFPAACQRIKISPDGQYIFASGYHPPRVRCYEVSQLSMKFERHLDSEIVDFQILSDDFSKAVFLCADRTVNFHARYGAHAKLRVPRVGRDLAYCPFSTEVLVAASAPEIYRINLEEGRFMSPIPTQSTAVNACGISPAHGLLGCAGEDGLLECFDPRQRSAVGCLDAAAIACTASGSNHALNGSLTTIRFSPNGMQCAVGTSGGLVAIFDLRSQRPLTVKDHMYDSPIVDLKFQTAPLGVFSSSSSQVVISSDKHAVRIWEADNGKGLATIEPPEAGSINDVCVWPDTGLIMVGADTPKIHAYFVPSLGPAPSWCSFLESLTEELEENTTPSVYDDYRFITKPELEKLGLTHLLGTQLLKAYMHGYFVDNRLYKKAMSIAEPFAYDAYRQKRIAEKMEEERKSRIGIVRKLPKVNAETAARLLSDKETMAEAAGGELDGAAKKKLKKKGNLPNLLEDNRFADMFENPDFTVDEASLEYKLLHPNVDHSNTGGSKKRDLVQEHFQPIDDDGDDNGDDYSDDDDAEEMAARKRRADRETSKRLSKEQRQPKQPRMFAARDDGAATAYMQHKSLVAEREMPLGMRVAAGGNGGGDKVRAKMGGAQELKFVPTRAPDGARRSGGGGGGRGRGGGRGGGGGGRGRGGRGRGRGRR